MNTRTAQHFMYLNHENQWIGFNWSGLEHCQDGALQLISLPLLADGATQTSSVVAPPNGPSGLAVDKSGTVYWSDPKTQQIFNRDACDATVAPVACIGGQGTAPTQLLQPRGLLVHPLRPILLVADAGNHRIQLFHLDTLQLVDVWGGPGTQAGAFNEPWSLAADAQGFVYVVDYGNQRVQKFDHDGNVVPSFWQTAQLSAPQLTHPTDVALTSENNITLVYVLDAARQAIDVLDANGQFQHSITLPANIEPMGLLVQADAIYLGDNKQQQLLKLSLEGTLLGPAAGYQGGVSALTMQYDRCGQPGDNEKRLWLHPGEAAAPHWFRLSGAYVKQGVMWGGPFPQTFIADHALAWHRLQALGEPLGIGRHFQFYLYTSDDGSIPPSPDNPAQQFDSTIWQAMPRNVAEVLVGATAKQLWIGARFSGDGRHSPWLTQMRVDYDHETYDKHLPAIYRKKSNDPETLQRFLSLFESGFVDVEGQIGDVRRLLDVATVPSERLDWLAGWLALQLEENWSDDKKRQAIARAFEAYAWRGTTRGLRQAIKFRTGIIAHIDEPLLHAHWWALPAAAEDAQDVQLTQYTQHTHTQQNGAASRLGFTTMLASAEAQGAVLGSSAVLDQSDLISAAQYGAPLFEDVAHQFSVQVYRAQLNKPSAAVELREVIEQEKPAHTAYHLCVIEARFRVGYQARLGIDTVVAGGPAPVSRLGDTESPATELVLGGQPPGNIGARSHVGRDTQLSAGAVGTQSPVECLHHPIFYNWEEDHGRN